MQHKSKSLALVAVALLALAGCQAKQVQQTSAPQVGEPGGSVPVQVAEVSTADMQKTVAVTGNLAALQDVELSAKATGRVAAVAAREGDLVTKGEVVVQQDATDLDANVQQAEANLLSAQAKLSQAYTNYRIGIVNADQGVLQAKAQVAQARDNYLKTKRGSRPEEILEAQDTLDSAKATRDNAKVILDRDTILFQQGAIAKQDLDQAQTTYDVDVAQYNNASEALKLAQIGNREEDIAASDQNVRQQETNFRNAVINREQVALRKDDIIAGQAGVAQAQAALKYDQEQAGFASIRAPFDGVVAMRSVEPGQEAGPGTNLMRIVNLKTVYYEPTVSETDIASISIGQTVDVRMDAIGGKVFEGKVAALFPAASAGDRTFMLRVTVDNPTGILRPGMFARGEIVTETHRNVPVVPATALVADAAGQGFQPNTTSDLPIAASTVMGPQHVVVVGPDNKAEIRHVTVGISNMDQAEIVSGVEVGDKIVVVGQANLHDGDKLAIEQDQPVASDSTAGATNRG